MKTLFSIERAIMVIVVVGVVVLLFTKPVKLWNLFKHNEEKVKSIKLDPEKIGKKVGDIRRKFLKGYHDTTTVKVDSTKLETQ